MLMLETALDRFDETDLAQMLSDLPPSWAVRATRKKPFFARLQSAVGYTLLRRILQNTYGITALPALSVDTHGKPHLDGCALHFSISHCKAAVACIVEDAPVAVDVQDILTDCTERFRERLGAPDHDDRPLTALWTKKEASAKLDGRGIAIGIENLPLPGQQFKTTAYDDFVLTVARPLSSKT